MINFDYTLPTRIKFGEGVCGQVGEVIRAIKSLEKPKAMLFTDSGVIAAGLLKEVEASLKQSEIGYLIFDQVEPNPRDTTVYKAVDIFKKEGANVLVAVGGGSVMDCAKAVGVIAQYGGEVAAYDGIDLVPGPITPLIAIPTTSGTGSEVTPVSVITLTKTHMKMGIVDYHVRPAFALVDPALTYTLPPSLTVGTGLDALTHAIECYTCVLASPVTDVLAMRAIQLIAESLPQAAKDGSDREARQGMSLGSLVAGMAFGNADCASVHSLSETIGGQYDAPHGMVNGILLPYVMDYNAQTHPQRYAEIARALGLEPTAQAAIEWVFGLQKELKTPRLADFGVKAEDLPRIAELAMQHPCTASNCRVPSQEGYLGILQRALTGK